MSIASDAVVGFQSYWADRFVDACQILDPLNNTNRGTMNMATYQYDSQASGVVYTGECLLRPMSTLDDDSEQFGQQAVTFTGAHLFLPFDAAVVDLDQEVNITASLTEAQLVGTTWIIRSIIRDSYNTHRKLNIELNLGTGIAY